MRRKKHPTINRKESKYGKEVGTDLKTGCEHRLKGSLKSKVFQVCKERSRIGSDASA